MGKYLAFLFFLFSISVHSQILTLTTTSKSSAWTPGSVVKSGTKLSWKASASGMADQIAMGIPTFDLSVSRTSDVTITATSSDGAEGFTGLKINSLNIISLNIDNAVALTELSVTDNQLTSLNLSENTALKNLFCHTNSLTSIDIFNNVDLTNFACFFNQISDLDLSNNTMLSNLACSNNKIKSLDLSKNIHLVSVECNDNLLEWLDIKNGNNQIIQVFKTTNNNNLFCIQVDDADYSENNWKDIDSWSDFNIDCTFTNEPPVAEDDQYETLENVPLTVEAPGILDNDSDPDGDVLMTVLETNVEHGILELGTDGSFIYTPEMNYYGSDQFTYKAGDGEFESNTATVKIDIILVNNPPEANDVLYSTEENILLEVNVEDGVLSNDTDPDNDPLKAELVTSVSHGSLRFKEDGSFVYSPDQNFYGEDSFTYKAFDGIEYSDSAEVTINVQAVYNIIVPNAFTPNNDEINDLFKPEYKGMEKVQLSVFDTWGNLIYFEEGEDLKGWDGTVKSRPAENGNYLYVIKAKPVEAEEVDLKGLFTLIR